MDPSSDVILPISLLISVYSYDLIALVSYSESVCFLECSVLIPDTIWRKRSFSQQKLRCLCTIRNVLFLERNVDCVAYTETNGILCGRSASPHGSFFLELARIFHKSLLKAVDPCSTGHYGFS